jgi:dihydropteroate synthase-like protein
LACRSNLGTYHFGFIDSLVRYHELRSRYSTIPLFMGVGNLTELTDADTTGINVILFGVISELKINAVLTTEVSPHTRRAVREADLARRIMYAAREDNALPRDFDAGLLCLRERRPFPDSPEEIAELALRIKDPSYRILRISQAGIHIFNRDGNHCAQDPFALFPYLAVAGDAGHAFYLGVELARAQIAWQLGKRYSQDEELNWGCAYAQEIESLNQQKQPNATLQDSKWSRSSDQS